MIRILFVCTGNICRSPSAEGIARQLATKLGVAHHFEFDSAGTHSYHTGEAPDERAQRAAHQHGYDLSDLRARPVTPEDFERFDRILAMDKGHLVWLRRACPPRWHHKLELLLDYSPAHAGQDLVDPYYGETEDFDRVIELCEIAIRGLLTQGS